MPSHLHSRRYVVGPGQSILSSSSQWMVWKHWPSLLYRARQPHRSQQSPLLPITCFVPCLCRCRPCLSGRWRVSLLSQTLLSPSVPSKDTFDYFGPTQIMQANIPILRSLITSGESPFLCKVWGLQCGHDFDWDCFEHTDQVGED